MKILIPSEFRQFTTSLPASCALCREIIPVNELAFANTRGDWVHLSCAAKHNRMESEKPTMTIDELVARSHKLAVDKGWAEKEVPVPEQVALICSEACEALEEYRNSKPMSYDGETGKPEGIGPEYADILIRIGHYARLNNIDLTYEVRRKLAYNETRPYRHGGKIA